MCHSSLKYDFYPAMNTSQYQVTASTNEPVAAISNYNNTSQSNQHQIGTFNGHNNIHDYNIHTPGGQFTHYNQIPQCSNIDSQNYHSQQPMIPTTGNRYTDIMCNRFKTLQEYSQHQWQRYNSSYDQLVNRSNQEFAILHQKLKSENSNTATASVTKVKSKPISNGRTKQYHKSQPSKATQSQTQVNPQLPPQKQLEALQTQMQYQQPPSQPPPPPPPPPPQPSPAQQQQHQSQGQQLPQQFNYPNEVPYFGGDSFPPIDQLNVQAVKQEEVEFTIGFLDGLEDFFADAEFANKVLHELNDQRCWVHPPNLTPPFHFKCANCKQLY